jgi:hypothetical protein
VVKKTETVEADGPRWATFEGEFSGVTKPYAGKAWSGISGEYTRRCLEGCLTMRRRERSTVSTDAPRWKPNCGPLTTCCEKTRYTQIVPTAGYPRSLGNLVSAEWSEFSLPVRKSSGRKNLSRPTIGIQGVGAWWI